MCQQEANKEKWKNDCFGGREIVTVWLKSRGLQANDEFFALLRTEGPRFHTGEILSWVSTVSGREELQSSQKGLPSTTLTVQASWHISVGAVSPTGFQGAESVKLLWRKETSFGKVLQAILLHPVWILLTH